MSGQLDEVVSLERQATAEGRLHGSELLAQALPDWRHLMRSDSRFRSFGTLRFLLAHARDLFEVQPSIAREITAVVLDFVDEVNDAPSSVFHVGLRGLAWKEHANALEYGGDLREAVAAAEKSISIYGELPTLHFDQTRARLVMANIQSDMGENAKAATEARACAAIFDDYAAQPFKAMARSIEAAALLRGGQSKAAFAVFLDLVEEAETAGDTLTMARALLNAGNCARRSGDMAFARKLYPRALAHFETLNLPTEATRVRWAHALLLADEGRVRHAISELFMVRAVFISLGMNTCAATAALDVVRIRFDVGEDVRNLCAELVEKFVEVGMTQNAVEALAYLREQARAMVLTTEKIARVRTYFDELSRRPNLLFMRPPADEG